MNLSEVAPEVAERLSAIPGLTCYAFQPDRVSPPAGWVANPAPGDIQYDLTYGRGMSRILLPVIIVVGRSDNRTAQERIRTYLDESGPHSVTAALNATQTWSSCHTVQAKASGADAIDIAAIGYLAALFQLDIAGQGG